MTTTFGAVLFDFAGTLLAPEDETAWIRAVLGRRGVDLGDDESARLAARLVAAGRPGPALPADVPAEHAAAFADRDLSMTQHRAAYTGLLGSVPLPEPVTADDLYDRSLDPDAWVPYADALPTLRALRRAGVEVVVVSNVGFDLRPIFAYHGLDEHVGEYVLSYELGVAKPDPSIFRIACQRAGVGPDRALMVGDTVADGAAVLAGVRALLLPASPPGAVHGLGLVLALQAGAAPAVP